MCTHLINGVLVVHEGTRRLRWQHEIHHQPSPYHPEHWVIGDLWPDPAARTQVQQRRTTGQPILVIFDQEPPQLTLPAENIPRIPHGATVHEADNNTVTVSIPTLDWLNKRDRNRGQAFAATARATIANTPRHLLAALLTEPWHPHKNHTLQFAHTTGTTRTANLGAIVDHLFGTTTPPGGSQPHPHRGLTNPPQPATTAS